MGADFLEALEIFTEFAVNAIGQDLGVFAIDDIALAIEEPCGDFVLCGVLDDCHDTLEFFGCKLSGAAGVVGQNMSIDITRGSWPTVYRDQHPPSCRPDWSTDDRRL